MNDFYYNYWMIRFQFRTEHCDLLLILLNVKDTLISPATNINNEGNIFANEKRT
jgi:hypothetical protein